jgi:lambda family phage minor tail protein L
MVELFELDATSLGGALVRFHAGTNQLSQAVIWKGNIYSAYPVQITGFEFSTGGKLPRPKMRVANVSGVMSAFLSDYQGLLGCKVTRRRTMAKYLDAANFAGGNPFADPLQELPEDVYYIDRLAAETKELVELELATSFDVEGVQLPRRQIITLCPWAYKGGTGCGYVPGAMFTAEDVATTDPSKDVCGKRLTSCQLRFGLHNPLDFGGFPSAGRTRVT